MNIKNVLGISLLTTLTACGGGGDNQASEENPPQQVAPEQQATTSVAEAAGLKALPQGSFILTATAGDTLRIDLDEGAATANITSITTAFNVQNHLGVKFKKTDNADEIIYETDTGSSPYFSLHYSKKYLYIKGHVSINDLNSRVIGTAYEPKDINATLKVDGVYNMVGSTDSTQGSTRELERTGVLVQGDSIKLCVGGLYINKECTYFRLPDTMGTTGILRDQDSVEYPWDDAISYAGDGSGQKRQTEVILTRNKKNQLAISTTYESLGTMTFMPSPDGMRLIIDVLGRFTNERIPHRAGAFFGVPQSPLAMENLAAQWNCHHTTTGETFQVSIRPDGSWISDEKFGFGMNSGRLEINKMAHYDASGQFSLKEAPGWGSLTKHDKYGVGAPFFIQGGFKSEVQHLPTGKVHRCTAPPRSTASSSPKTA